MVIFLCIFLFIQSVFLNGQDLMQYEVDFYELEQKQLYAKSAALMDGDSGRVLYGKEENTLLANASTTKILTCIVALENSNLEDTVTVSKNAQNQPKVRMGIKENEIYTMQDLLYALMLESYNDCAVAIAEYIAGSVEAFAKMLNEKAKEIGCSDTYFITPNGLDAEDEIGKHHTTAKDLCLLMKYCAWDSACSETFLKITQTKNVSVSNQEGKTFSLVNRNAFLDMYDGVICGKTGFTADAGYCYVCAYEQDGKKFCVSLLACGWPNNKTYKWSDAKKILDYGVDNFYYVEIKSPSEFSKRIVRYGRLENLSIENWRDEYVLGKNSYTTDAETLRYLVCKKDRVERVIDLCDSLEAPLKSNDKVGTIEYRINGETVKKYSIFIRFHVTKFCFGDLLDTLFYAYLLGGE